MRALLLLVVLLCSGVAARDDTSDATTIIEAIRAADSLQRAAVYDVTFDAELLEGEYKDDQFVAKERYLKKVYVKFLPDTAWFAEGYERYFKEDEPQDSSELVKKARERYEQKVKRKARDISYPMLRPFYPESQDNYEISYIGSEPDVVEDLTCYHFRVRALAQDPDLLNGDYYFEAESFHLARVDFSPAKLTKKTMFKMNQLDMTMLCEPTPDGWWLPSEFSIRGKGKAMFLIGVNFAAVEYYRNPQINTGLDDQIFEAYHEQY